MLVKERMSKSVVIISPDMPIMEALQYMKEKKVRRFPVIKNDKLVGIVSEKDLLNAGPSEATSLSVYELHYLVSKIKVKDIMIKKVLTVTEDTLIEDAARIMVENKIGGLPVMQGDKLVGIITETDLFKMFLEMMGARDRGLRVTALIPDKPGILAQITKAIAEAGGSFLSFGICYGQSKDDYFLTFKVNRLTAGQVETLIAPIVEKVVDIR